MDLMVTDVKLKYGLMLWEQRHQIIEEVEKNGSANCLLIVTQDANVVERRNFHLKSQNNPW